MDAVFSEPNCIIIDSFHGEVIKLQSQISEVLRIFLYIRLKIKEKEILVQVSSPVACFISKLQQFELPSFHTAWQNRNAISLEKKSLCSWLSAVKPFWMLEHVSMYTDASSRVERKSFYRKTEHQMFFADFWQPYLCEKTLRKWRLHTKHYNGVWNVSANNSETVGHIDLRLGQMYITLL